MELSYISRVLDAVGGNKASAARLLGVDRTTLYRKLHRQEHDPAPACTRSFLYIGRNPARTSGFSY
jgi:DNA-binding NtrC family response regulator